MPNQGRQTGLWHTIVHHQGKTPSLYLLISPNRRYLSAFKLWHLCVRLDTTATSQGIVADQPRNAPVLQSSSWPRSQKETRHCSLRLMGVLISEAASKTFSSRKSSSLPTTTAQLASTRSFIMTSQAYPLWHRQYTSPHRLRKTRLRL